MAGHALTRYEKANAERRREDEIAKFDAAAPVDPEMTLKELSRKHKGKLDRCRDARAKIELINSLTGYDPHLRLIFLTQLRSHVTPYINQLKEIIKYEPMSEPTMEALKGLIAFLKEVPMQARDEAKIHMELMKYEAPQLRSMAVEQKIDQSISINVSQFGSK